MSTPDAALASPSSPELRERFRRLAADWKARWRYLTERPDELADHLVQG